MINNKAWFKFLITGNPKDYVDYKNKSTQQNFYGGDDAEYFDRWPCDKGNEYKG